MPPRGAGGAGAGVGLGLSCSDPRGQVGAVAVGRGQPHGWAGQDRRPWDPAPARTRRAGGVGREGHGALINVTVLGLLALPVCGGGCQGGCRRGCSGASGDAGRDAGICTASVAAGSSTTPGEQRRACPKPLGLPLAQPHLPDDNMPMPPEAGPSCTPGQAVGVHRPHHRLWSPRGIPLFGRGRAAAFPGDLVPS